MRAVEQIAEQDDAGDTFAGLCAANHTAPETARERRVRELEALVAQATVEADAAAVQLHLAIERRSPLAELRHVAMMTSRAAGALAGFAALLNASL